MDRPRARSTVDRRRTTRGTCAATAALACSRKAPGEERSANVDRPEWAGALDDPGGPVSGSVGAVSVRHPNADLIERFYTALGSRDGVAMAACYTPEASFEDPAFGKLDADDAGCLSLENFARFLRSFLTALFSFASERVLGLRNLAELASASAPVDAPPWYGHRWMDADGGAWQEIDLARLARDPEFLQVGR